ncbi:putative bifunctional diguanylate cyclase/phosphodiesterase [Microvirga pudoricolor]|uniref:putative bifunctional diguanylate cyclase/phosphodiesterase n=1 Tax=Microvirga pudoricolor TaxID=2778729 RepID=UPI00194FE7ED|nr:EAL domain-containing protein [Microvirga pudoricolor]MBM6593321.1 EAL domain-containing protein [Microvirga pudoricolor]
MTDPSTQRLSAIGGEFIDSERERAFQAERMPETVRHLRLLFLLSALLNTLFFISDWRFYGQPHFLVAFPARAVVVAVSLGCWLAISRVATFRQAQATMLVWQWVTALAVGALVSSHSDLALFVVVMLPSIYYLVVPNPFRWTVISGAGCSILMLVGYLSGDDTRATATGLVLAVLVLNFALVLVVTRSNRLRRLEWAATQAERRAKEELTRSRAMFERLFRTVPLPLVVVKTDGGILDTNDAAVTFFGANRDVLGIRSVDEIYIHPEDRVDLITALKREGRVNDFETMVRLADGSIRNVLVAATLVEVEGADAVISAVIDITDRKAAEERIWRAASHDPLTDLPNRALFQSRFELALADANHTGNTLTLFLIDLDDFKAINDTRGHDAGDALLQEMAERLRRMMRDEDTVARLGGDEFVVIVGPPLRMEHAGALANRILDEMRRPFVFKGEPIESGASIGIAVYPDHDSKPAELMKDADLALYSAKAQGRNRAVLFSPDMRNLVEHRATMTRDIQEALQEGQIVPFYQPKVNLVTGEVIGFEALARWDHPQQGLLSPSAFPLAFNDPELSALMGEHIVRQVAADIRRWLDQGVKCGRVAVNLSTSQFSWIGLSRRFLDILEAAGVPPHYLDVEITETVFLGRASVHVMTALQQFHEHGIRIALDDFGTGYASLIHLKQFPVDDIKIDQSFIRDVDRDSESAAIVVAVIDLGKSLCMDVIAEGVETVEQALFLRDHGCPFVQGNLYSLPLRAEAVVEYLGRERLRLPDPAPSSA